MQSPPARALPDYFLKDHKPSARRGEDRLRGPERTISSKTISPRLSRTKPAFAGYGRYLFKDHIPTSRQRTATCYDVCLGCDRRIGSPAAGACIPCSSFWRPVQARAQTPPSLLVGEGGWGEEGQKCTGMQKTAYLSQELHPQEACPVGQMGISPYSTLYPL
jgi:hypothetical protein